MPPHTAYKLPLPLIAAAEAWRILAYLDGFTAGYDAANPQHPDFAVALRAAILYINQTEFFQHLLTLRDILTTYPRQAPGEVEARQLLREINACLAYFPFDLREVYRCPAELERDLFCLKANLRAVASMLAALVLINPHDVDNLWPDSWLEI